MGVLDNLFGFARSAPAATTSATPPAPPVIPIPYVSSSTIVGLSAVWRCVTLIADVIARWPWQEWTGDKLVDPSRLVRSPMATMSRREWTWRVVATEALHNITYLLHASGYDSEGVPWSLMPLPPAAIRPAGFGDPWGLLPPPRYVVAGVELDASQLTIIRRAPWPGVPEHVAGIIDLARRQFQSAIAADTLSARYWMNGGPTSTILKTDQRVPDEEADRIAARWDAKRAQGGTAFISSGADAHPFGADPTTESAVEARTQMVADIGRYFGVPTRILNAPAHDSETYANVELDAIDLTRYTLGGYVDPLEEAISGLLPGSAITGRRLRLDASAFVSGSLTDRATAYGELVDKGIVTRREARVKGFGLPPDPDELDAGDGSPDLQVLPGGAAEPAGRLLTATTAIRG